MSEVMPMIGERLAEVRKDHGDTQQTLADKLNVTKYTVSSWEQEKSEPGHEMLARICRMYGVASDYLLGLSDFDPVYFARSVESLHSEDQALIREIKEFLAWRRRRMEKADKA